MKCDSEALKDSSVREEKLLSYFKDNPWEREEQTVMQKGKSSYISTYSRQKKEK